ncbi:Transposon TX1 uncharacterized 149 kDa protein [Vitis vinifera]|uniref:Transposon TX1 uncharacterized 149 kDa protein n=1 Tax=Vitis vinifera TaxID=29760 RepID=A0A438BYN0_VITVI|nr:Transposon TX1 uncharacterized 149 kDa protein [Vitis vinifera]
MEELDWLMEHLKKAVEVEASRGFVRKIRGKTKTLLMEICFNNRGRFMKITEFVTKRKPLVLVVPEGVKGKGWEDLRKAILSVQEYYERDGGASKEKNGDIRMNRDTFRGGRSYAEVVAEAGLRTGGMWSAGKWARAVICESQEEVHDWTHVGRAIARMMGMKGMVSINAISAFKGCFFVSTIRRAESVHDQGRLSVKGRTILLRKWSPKENMVVQGKFRKGLVAKETLKLVDLTRAKLWVEMLPNVVLPALLEVEDGEWSYTVAVSVAGEDEDVDVVTSEVNRSRNENEWVRVGGCVSQSSKMQKGYESRTCLADKGETGGGWSRSGQAEAIFIGPEHESSFKAQQVRAQSGMRHRGLQDGPDEPQDHQSASASPLSPQRAASSTKATATLCQDGARAGVEVFFGEEGRADELKAQSFPKFRPLSDNIVGCRGGKEIEARKGKAPAVYTRDATQEEETAISKKTWSTLFPPSADRRQGHRCCSEPFFTRGSSSSSEDHNMVEEFGMGFQMDRGIRVNPLSRCHLSGKLSKEDTSASRVEVQGGLSGRVGFDPRGYSDMGSPSNSIIRGKGLICEGFCEIPGAKNLEVCQPSLSQPPESPSIPSCSPDSPLKNPSGPILPNSVSLPHPDRVEEENQCALSNQMSESCTTKDSIVRSHKEVSGGRAEAPQGIETCWFWLGRLGSLCFPMKIISWNETKKENCDRRFVGSVWTVRNKDWVCSSGVWGFSQVLFGRLWTPLDFAVYGPNSPSLRKDFWVELFDIYGLTYPLWPSRSLNQKDIGSLANRYGYQPVYVGPTPFRFENMWLQHTNFKENFRDWWSGFQGIGWEGHKFMRRLQYVKAKLKEWNKSSFGELKEKKKSILNDLANFDAIEQEGGLNPDLISQRVSRKGELEELILREEIHWRQKAKVKWVKEGDCNSKFYHKVANGRRNRKYIKELENERGESWGVEGLDWSPISEESALRLESPFTEEEISKAIFQLDRNKAPGPDGFTIAVFQECWDVIKEDLVRVFAEFHRSGIINQSTNASFIVLIPKKSLSKRISDFRPISLITSLYKIIAKVLSGRLRGVLHVTIHYTQGAFVQGRQILDAVLIANEIVDERRRSREEGVVFKIDFEKAYDHVKWDFLDHVLEKKGFSPRWRKWMSGCLSSVSFAILVNGSAKGWVKASRGLRQGDPLSPFLFTLVADVLSRMLMRAEERNMLEGFRVGRNRTRVSHLQFADDTIFFSNSREEELQTLKSLLLVFGHISGLKVNLNKSSIYGINLDQAHLSRLAEMLDCKASGWPILYLGLPLGGNPKACGFWDPVVERISSRLDGWQKAYLSFGGRITLIQSCLTHLPNQDNRGFGFGEYFLEEPRSTREMVMESDGLIAVLGRLLLKSFRNSEIEDLEGLMRSLDDLYLSPSVPDARLWPLSSSGLFSVKSFFLALSQSSGSSQNFPSKFVWNSQVPFKVKSFVWLVAHKKHGESVDHLFLHCSLTIGLWHRLFQLAKLDWVSPRSIYDMMSIKFKGFGNSKRGIVLWQAASIALIRVVWWERNARIFEDKARNSEYLWDSIVFLASLWAFCSKAFKGIPLNVIQLDWIAVCTP